MSRFFSDLEEEKKEIKKKFNAPQKQVEKLSKKDKLQIDFETRVKDLIKNPKNLKKFISDLKKYENLEIPEFIEEFLLSEKVYQKSNKKAIDDFLKKGQEEVDIMHENIQEDVEVVNVIDEDQKYEDLLKIKDKDIRITKMTELYESLESNFVKINILIHLLSSYTKDKDTIKIFDIFTVLLRFYDNQKAKNIIDTNIDFYLDLFKAESYNYESSLEMIKNINKDIYERRVLEIEYNNGRFVDSDHLDFKFLYFIRNNRLDECLKVINNINLSIKHDDIFTRNIEDCAFYLFSNKRYLESYKCLLYIFNYTTDNIRIKKILYILCVICNKSLKGNDFFKSFLVDFKRFGLNTFVQKSKDEVMEIFRSFYLLHNYDAEGAYDILRDIDIRFNDKEVLEDFILNL